MSTSREAGIEPHISIDIVFVEHGYQIDYYVNGKFQGTECRDFGGNHRIRKLIKDFLSGFEEWLHKFKDQH